MCCSFLRMRLVKMSSKVQPCLTERQRRWPVVRTSFFHLRILSKVKGCLPRPPKGPGLDRCNSRHLDCSLMYRLQNAVAGLFTGSRKHDRKSPQSWPHSTGSPVLFRIDFKILLFIFTATSWTGTPGPDRPSAFVVSEIGQSAAVSRPEDSTKD